MSIRVEVENYCQACLMFDPDVPYPDKFYAENDLIDQTDTVIRCRNRKQCARLMQYLKKHGD